MWKNKILIHIQKNKKEFTVLCIGLVMIVFVLDPFSKKTMVEEKNEVFREPQRSMDTIIPEGFQLVPLEISNGDSVRAMVSSDPIVDLYGINTQGQPGKLLLKNVRLFQAPLNPEQYAALLQEGNTTLLLKHPGPYFAAIRPYKSKNKNTSRPEQKIKNFKSPRIKYGDEQ